MALQQKHLFKWAFFYFPSVLVLAYSSLLRADNARIAVAANFASTFEALQKQFESQNPHTLTSIPGSTNTLVTQIRHGAPYDVLLAADEKSVEMLIKSDVSRQENSFVYACGRLALFYNPPINHTPGNHTPNNHTSNNHTPNNLTASNHTPKKDKVTFRSFFSNPARNGKVALANPKLAPYGKAAVDALQAIEQYENWQDNLVWGQNIAQTFQMVASQNARAGLVSLAQVIHYSENDSAHYAVVPETFHQPIRQRAALLHRAQDNMAATKFFEYLATDGAKKIIHQYGYGVVPTTCTQ